MIQRIQTLYTLLSAVISLVIPLNFKLWNHSQEILFLQDVVGYLIIALLSTLMAILSIFYYKNRQHQFFINRLNILLNFILIGFYSYQILTLNIQEKGLGALTPAIVIVLLALANKAIKKDENLIKSLDRIR